LEKRLFYVLSILNGKIENALISKPSRLHLFLFFSIGGGGGDDGASVAAVLVASLLHSSGSGTLSLSLSLSLLPSLLAVINLYEIIWGLFLCGLKLALEYVAQVSGREEQA
jgi:hypothetical protein